MTDVQQKGPGTAQKSNPRAAGLGWSGADLDL
jgi:hypothetical protein